MCFINNIHKIYTETIQYSVYHLISQIFNLLWKFRDHFRFLYVAEYTAKKVSVYRTGDDAKSKTKKVLDVPLYASPVNVNIDPMTGNLWVATQPKKFGAFLHVQNPEDIYTASQVYLIN